MESTSGESADFHAEAERIAALRDPTERLLRSGVLALIHAGRAVLENGLSPEVITRTAGRSRRSYYDHFRGKAQFTEQLYDELLGIGGPTRARIDVADFLLSLNQGDLADTLFLMAKAPTIGNVERVNRIARQIVTALGANDPYARDRIRDFYARDRLVYEPVIASLIDSWGIELREPWTVERATLVFRIVIDGMAMRSLVDDDLEETDMVFLVLKTLLPGIGRLRHSADTNSVDDLVQELSDTARKYMREREDPSVVLDARSAVQAATLEELAKRGFSKTTLEGIERTSGISQTTIRRSMGEVVEICCEMLDGLVAGLESAVEIELSGPLAADPRAMIDRHLDRTAELFLSRRPLIEAWTVMLVSGAEQKAVEVTLQLTGILDRLVQVAAASGQVVAPTQQQRRTAATAVTQALTRTAELSGYSSPAEEARTLLDMCFDWTLQASA